MIDLSKYIIHDLTHSLGEHIAGFASKPARTLATDGWNAQTLTIYSHAGTHMDAPFHFGVSDQTIDQFTPQDLMCHTWIAKVTVTESKQLITVTDLGDVSKQLKPGQGLMICTNWHKKYKDKDFKSGLPRISAELAQWCVDRRVKMLGVEPLSVADVENLEEVTSIHQTLLGGGVIIVEGLKNLDLIQSNQVFFMALPLKIKNGDGAPARALAFELKPE